MGRLSETVNAITEGVKVNVAWRDLHEGKPRWCKRRRALGGPVLTGANLFFHAVGAPISALSDVGEWRRWEIESFRLLHGAEGFQAAMEGARGVACAELPGRNLTDFLDGGTMTPPMAAAAGRELRRAHGLTSSHFGDGWSHGDAHAGNFVYDERNERARLIDFELRHREELGAAERQKDDVLGFLLDMVGRIAAERWAGCAAAFLHGYDAGEMILEPAPGLWTRVRTTFLGRTELKRRWAAIPRREPARV